MTHRALNPITAFAAVAILCFDVEASVVNDFRGTSDIVGQWRMPIHPEEKIEFFEDHTFAAPSYAGTYSILRDGRLKMDATVLGTRQIEVFDHISLINGWLSMVEQNGAKTVWLKIGDTPDIVSRVDEALFTLFGRYPAEEKGAARDQIMALQGKGVETRLIQWLSIAPTPASRMVLSRSLAEREVKEGVPVMLEAATRAAGDQEKKEILNSVRGIATDAHMESLLNALSGTHSADVRRVFENIILAVYARKPRNEDTLGPLLKRVSQVSGDEKRSLMYVLGTLGGDAVLTQLKGIFDGQSKADQYDAMTGLLNWQDRAVVPLLQSIIDNSDDKALKIAAIRTLARVVALPAPGTPQQLVASWRNALDLSDNTGDAQRVFTAVADTPMPESHQLLADYVEDSRFKNIAAQYQKLMTDIESKTKDISPREVLPATGIEQLRGNQSGVLLDEETNAFVRWNSPETWFSFHFKVREAGTYDIDIIQSYGTKATSSFQVVIGDKAIDAKARSTDAWDEYEPVEIESRVELEPGKIYTLHIRAKGITQPRMMNLKGISLAKR